MAKAPTSEKLLKALMRHMNDADLVEERDLMQRVGVDNACPNLVICLDECEKRGL